MKDTTFISTASAAFPGVTWTGGSRIHVSLAKQIFHDLATKSPEYFVSNLIKSGRLEHLYDGLCRLFPAFEFHPTRREFVQLLVADALSQLRGKGPLTPHESIVNPRTRSVFHCIATHDDFVGGIRVWIQPSLAKMSDGGTKSAWFFCFRFRIVAPTETRNRSRSRARNTVEDPCIVMELEGIDLEFNEPNTATAANKVELFEGEFL